MKPGPKRPSSEQWSVVSEQWSRIIAVPHLLYPKPHAPSFRLFLGERVRQRKPQRTKSCGRRTSLQEFPCLKSPLIRRILTRPSSPRWPAQPAGMLCARRPRIWAAWAAAAPIRSWRGSRRSLRSGPELQSARRTAGRSWRRRQWPGPMPGRRGSRAGPGSVPAKAHPPPALPIFFCWGSGSLILQCLHGVHLRGAGGGHGAEDHSHPRSGAQGNHHRPPRKGHVVMREEAD